MTEDMAVRLAVLEERVRGKEVALDLQAAEYLRRLDELNHAHDKQVEDQATYISSDKYDGFVAEMHGWQRQVQTTLDELKGKTRGGASAKASAFQIVTLLVALAGLAVSAAMAVWGRA